MSHTTGLERRPGTSALTSPGRLSRLAACKPPIWIMRRTLLATCIHRHIYHVVLLQRSASPCREPRTSKAGFIFQLLHYDSTVRPEHAVSRYGNCGALLASRNVPWTPAKRRSAHVSISFDGHFFNCASGPLLIERSLLQLVRLRLCRKMVSCYCTGRGVRVCLLQGTCVDYGPCSRMMHRRSQLGMQGWPRALRHEHHHNRHRLAPRANAAGPIVYLGPHERHALLGQRETTLPAERGSF